MEQIAIYGGTFNPVHLGHLHLAAKAQAALGFDRLLFIPARIPPHKAAVDLAPGAARLEMLRLAAAEIPNAQVSDIELKSKGKSYTIYTLEKLAVLFPKSQLTLLMGSDMLLTFDQWFRWRDILKLAALAVLAREADELPALRRKAAALAPGRVTVIPAEPLPVSSTQIRRMIQGGRDPSALLPPSVADYIAANKLYKKDKQ